MNLHNGEKLNHWKQDPGLVVGSPPQNEAEAIHGLEDTNVCAILDSGATVMCYSTIVV